jgi:hypothetical protein
MTGIIEAQNPRFASAVFCDDIRYEVGNKITLVGLYNRDLFVSAFPAHLNRLAVSLTIDMPIGEKVESIGVVVEKGDEIIFEIPSQNLAALPKSQHNNDAKGRDAPSRLTFGMQFFLPPTPVLEDCTIRVRAILGEEIITAGKLFISTWHDEQKNPN